MKTQLLQDFQESGSTQGPPKPPDPAPAGPASAAPPAAAAPPAPAPPRPPRPAVWHGPGAQGDRAGAAVQKAAPGPVQRAPDTTARGLGVAIEAWAERAAQERPPSQPPPFLSDEATVPGAHASPRPAAPTGPSGVPPYDQPEGASHVPLTGQPSRPGHVPPPRPPEPAASAHHADAGAGTIPRPTPAEAEADWLAARLRMDAAGRDAPAWSSVWKRRLVTWSIAGGLLAGLAAGGLWLYEENRVDGALVVVANTSPAGAAPRAAAGGAQAFAAGAPAAGSPAGSPAVLPALPAQATVPDAVTPPSALASAADAVKPVPAPVEPGKPVEPDVAATPGSGAAMPAAGTPALAATPSAANGTAAPIDVRPPRRIARHGGSAHKRAGAKVRRAQAPDEPPVAAAPSPRQRREETLMQCRAHGYDARQCIERGCTMTRYGLACKG